MATELVVACLSALPTISPDSRQVTIKQIEVAGCPLHKEYKQ